MSLVELPVYIVDAFTNKPFSGNPAGVCLCDGVILSDEQMQNIAKELRHSETAFVYALDATAGLYQLRWFTPLTEVKLCGHATLATAHVLFSEGYTSLEELTFQTLSGNLIVSKNKESLQMNFPQSFCSPLQLTNEIQENLATSLGLSREYFSGFFFDETSKKLIVELKHYKHVVQAIPDSEKIMEIKFPVGVRGICITTPNLEKTELEGQFDFATRYFAPWVGIPEDPVNGWSHTILGGFYSKKLHKETFLAYMASQRTGVIGVQLVDSTRVILEGKAVTVVNGKIRL